MNYSCEALIATCLLVAGCGNGVDPAIRSAGGARAVAPIAPIARITFESVAAAEALATITVRCAACAWDQAGSEAVVINIKLDDHEAQRLPIVRRGLAEYRLLLDLDSLDRSSALAAKRCGREFGIFVEHHGVRPGRHRSEQ